MIDIKMKLQKSESERLELLEQQVITSYFPSFESLISNPRTLTPINAAPYEFIMLNAEKLGLYELKINHDIKAAKNYFYLSELSRIRAYTEYQDGARSIMDGFLPNGFRAPLSGANHLYSLLAEMRHPVIGKIGPDSKERAHLQVRCQQEALIKNLDALPALCDEFNKYPRDYKPYEDATIAFFRSLCTNHTPTVEDALRAVLDAKTVRKANRGFARLMGGEFMCLPGMWLAKLAWINGHEIEIKHPLVISELLPEEPLHHYENPYEFLIDPVLDNKPIVHCVFWPTLITHSGFT